MTLMKRFFHFLYAVRDSFSSLVGGLFLLLVAVVGLRAIPTLNSSQEISLLLGVIASIVATLILRVSERYSDSCSAMSAILGGVDDIATYIETVAINSPHFDIHKFKLWQMYVDICEKSQKLTYEKDFFEISKEVSGVVDAVYGRADKETLIEEAKHLREVAGKLAG